MKKFLLIIVIFLSACSQKISTDEWAELQQVINQADEMTVGVLPHKNKEESIKIISDIIVQLQTLSIKDNDLKWLQNRKIKYYQTVFQLLTTNPETEQYWQLEQQLLQLAQENYQLEQQMKQEYAPNLSPTL
ncbi:MAG: hypothetical protein N4Q32_02080 [Neisseriaceae bacterium]|nr:hypothetical protein [Neisseriaceae bacterium PsAf]MCV2503550.1 hypothetical protein [Neisseriaceae bacterium]MCV2509208.1 hypothetical protein [Neisseriaceae bacterium]